MSWAEPGGTVLDCLGAGLGCEALAVVLVASPHHPLFKVGGGE